MSTASELRAKRALLLPASPGVEIVRAAKPPTLARPPLGEIGNTGTWVASAASGRSMIVEDDYNPELRGMAFFKEIDRMRKSDSQVKAVMSMLKLPLRAADWNMDAASDQPIDQEIAEWCEDKLLRGQMRTWDYVLRHILLSLDFGTMPFEMVWAVEDDDILHRPMVQLKKMAPRMPNTIIEWHITPEGDLQSVYQQTANALTGQIIEGERLLPFVHEMEGSNYRGTSILRNARKDWTIKERLQRINQVAIEKRASGVDVGKMDETAISDSRNKGAFENVLMSVRTHEKNFMLLPPGHEYTIEGITGQVLDPLPSIAYADVMILRGILADFLSAGTNKEGSYALVRDRSSFFLMALAGIANEIIDPINRWLIPRWVKWNWPGVTDFPMLTHSRLDRRDVSVTASALKDLIPLGVLTPDDHIEHELRAMLDLPDLADTHDPSGLLPPGAPGAPPISDPNNPNSPLLNPDTGPAAFRRLKNGRARPYEIRSRTMKPARTKAERAVDWILLSSALDTAENKIVQAYRSIQDRQIEKLVDEAMKAIEKSDPAMLEQVNVPYKNDAAVLIAKPLMDLYRLGQNEVKTEMARMGGNVIRLSGPLDVEQDQAVLAFLKARGRMIATVLADRLRGSMVRTGMDMIRDGTTDRLVLKGALTELSDRAIKAEAGRTISEALNMGRESTAKRNESLVQQAEYSAIMDNVTCESCSRLEGQTFEYGSSEFDAAKPPYQDCDGRGRCRCVMIYTFASEAP